MKLFATDFDRAQMPLSFGFVIVGSAMEYALIVIRQEITALE